MLALLLTLISCKKEKAFEYCELGIVLTDRFESYDSEGAYDVAYADGDLIVGISRFSFVDCEQEYGILATHSPLKFAQIHLARYGQSSDITVAQHGDVPYYSYSMSDLGGFEYFYMPTFYRTPYAYFVITFVTPYDNVKVQRDKIFEYIETVYILEEHI